MTDEPVKPMATDTVPWTEFSHGDNFALRYRHLSTAMGPQPYKIGVAIEELPAGKQNCPAHYHLREEEYVIILSGALTVRIGKDHHVMKAGDFVRFPPKSPHEHCLYNHTDEVCRYIIIGDRDENDVCVYPDSNKVGVTALGQRFMRDHKDYWHGEGELTGKKPEA